jgi:hypothetical protein
MVISSRTPEGRPNHCPVCGTDLTIEPSDPAGDAPCPRCGHLLWSTWGELGDEEVVKLTDNLIQPESLDVLIDSVAKRPGMRFVLDFSEVPMLSSVVFVKLIMLKKQAGTVRRQVVLRHVHPDLLEVFRITRLDRVVDMEP